MLVIVGSESDDSKGEGDGGDVGDGGDGGDGCDGCDDGNGGDSGETNDIEGESASQVDVSKFLLPTRQYLRPDRPMIQVEETDTSYIYFFNSSNIYFTNITRKIFTIDCD